MRIEERNGELVIIDFNELEACKIACKIEKDGIHFYTRLLEKVEAPEDKEALAFLIKKEREHLKLFEKELSKQQEKKEDAFEEDDLFGEMDYGVFQPYQSMEDLHKALTTREKALRLGLVVEKKSIQFYDYCREHVTSDESKKELSMIIEEERKHQRMLEEMLGES